MGDLKAYKLLFCAFLTRLGNFFGLIAVRKVVKRPNKKVFIKPVIRNLKYLRIKKGIPGGILFFE